MAVGKSDRQPEAPASDLPPSPRAAGGVGGKGDSLRARPLAELAAARGREIVLDWKRNPLVCRITPWGRGRVIQLAVDLGTLFRYSRSPLAVRALGALVGDLPRPPAEVVEGAPLLMGIFGRHSREAVIHLQQFPAPWEGEQARAPRPPVRWRTVLQWNGRRPRRVRCALPEPGPALPITRRGGGWQVVLPPMTWGQVVVVEL